MKQKTIRFEKFLEMVNNLYTNTLWIPLENVEVEKNALRIVNCNNARDAVESMNKCFFYYIFSDIDRTINIFRINEF